MIRTASDLIAGFKSREAALGFYQERAFAARYFGESEIEAAERKLDAFVALRILHHGA